MTILERVYASGGPEVAIATLELSCDAWDDSLFLCQGFEDQVFTTEDARTVTFQAAGIDVAIPKRDNSGAQEVGFAIDNVTGEAQQRIDAALDAGAKVFLTLRIFLDTDRSAPAEPPYRMVVKSGKCSAATLEVTAGYYDLINTAWPRDVYTTTFAPGLKYIG